MGELTATVLAAEEGGGGTSNFLVPNGTFFVVLLIFLIVLGVIWTWVVPPVSKVLAAREEMLSKTAADNKRAAEQVAAAQADYDEAMAGARGEASSIRDEARSAVRQRPAGADRRHHLDSAGVVGGRPVNDLGESHPGCRRQRCPEREALMS